MRKLLTLIFILTICVSSACAETVWVLCQPDSYVNVRPSPGRKGEPVAYMECGDYAEAGEETKNGFLHLTYVPSETGEGWINKGFIVYSQPFALMMEVNVHSNGRVACWRSIGGKRRCWVKNGDTLRVYYVSEEWTITNKGFIKTEFLGVDYYTISQRTVFETPELYFEDD